MWALCPKPSSCLRLHLTSREELDTSVLFGLMRRSFSRLGGPVAISDTREARTRCHSLQDRSACECECSPVFVYLTNLVAYVILCLSENRIAQRLGSGIVVAEAGSRESGKGESPIPAQAMNGPGSCPPKANRPGEIKVEQVSSRSRSRHRYQGRRYRPGSFAVSEIRTRDRTCKSEAGTPIYLPPSRAVFLLVR